ncbi:putative zinc finger protein 702 [Scylla paramamosain]|uniref:putative zinc finger protein 702 n=1 Tax=Scylla paramamosain TaxID=85552 RepID=UPI003082D1B8
MACATGSSTVVEAVRPGISMSGQQQQQSALCVGRCRHGGSNHQEAGNSCIRGQAKFECQLCDKTFKYKSWLRQHTLTHSGVRDYECEECGKKFTAKFSLTRHNLTHSGVSNHECDECGKKFTQKGKLTTHILTNSGVKNYECEECGKKFTTKSDLSHHGLTHWCQES